MELFLLQFPLSTKTDRCSVPSIWRQIAKCRIYKGRMRTSIHNLKSLMHPMNTEGHFWSQLYCIPKVRCGGGEKGLDGVG